MSGAYFGTVHLARTLGGKRGFGGQGWLGFRLLGLWDGPQSTKVKSPALFSPWDHLKMLKDRAKIPLVQKKWLDQSDYGRLKALKMSYFPQKLAEST